MSQPWVDGPAEILAHGLEHLERDGDVDRRLAMISIDNAVELMLKTYLNQPRRAHGGPGLSLKQRREIGDGFFDQLEALEQHAPERLEGIDLASLEYFHGLRNQLYHQGNGLTVERAKVQVYGELARLLFTNLFEQEPSLPSTSRSGAGLVWELLTAWAELYETVVKRIGPQFRSRSNIWWALEEDLPPNLAQEMQRLRSLRNAVGHGDAAAVESLSQEDVAAVLSLKRELEKRFELG